MPNKLKDAVRHKFKKKSYNKRDWKAYDKSLKNRGNLTIWFEKDAVENWNHNHNAKRKRGGQKQYSDLAIQTCHVFRTLFKQALRQTEGLVESIIRLLNLDLKTPDHTTLSIRLKTLKISKNMPSLKERLIIVIDSTGLKIMGEKEWMNHKHGTKQKKVWLKLHLAIDEKSGEILANTLTEHTISDTAEVEPLLNQIEAPIEEVLGDGGYDHKPTYDAIDKHAQKYPDQPTVIVVPPNIGFQQIRDSDHKERIKNQKIIDEHGREQWQKVTDYGRRSKVEGTFSRWKRIVGGSIKSKNKNSQVNEIQIGVLVLNKTMRMNPEKARKSA